jgi:hypothetical protein
MPIEYVSTALLMAFALTVPLLLICLPAVLDALSGALQRRQPDVVGSQVGRNRDGRMV